MAKGLANENPSTAGTNTGNAQGVDKRPASVGARVGGKAGSGTKVTGARQASVKGRSVNRGKPSQGRPNTQKATSTDAAVPKGDWRQSRLTSFIGWSLVVAGVIELVAHYSPYKEWSPLVAFGIGIVCPLVLLPRRVRG